MQRAVTSHASDVLLTMACDIVEPGWDRPVGTFGEVCMGKLIIGLAGRAGSGKSTCAQRLIDEYGATPFSFALPLKELARDVFGFSPEQVFGSQAEKETVDPRWGLSPRELLIRLGNGARIRLGPDVWVRACMNAIASSDCSIAVISDVRYPNEAEAITEAGGYVIRLQCPDALTSVDPNAPSEKSVDEIESRFIYWDASIPRSPGARLLLDAFDLCIGTLIKEAQR